MTLVVHAGIYRNAVIRHLALLVPPEVWTIDQFGFVDLVGSVPPTLATPAVQALQAITGVNGLVEIHGSEAAAEIVVSGNIQRVGDVGGAAFIDPTALGPDARVPIIYDSSDNYGVGYWVRGVDGTLIDCPPHIVLGHELAHAVDALNGTYTPAAAEATAIAFENALRAAHTPPLPLRGTHDGGKKTKPPSPPTTTPPRNRGGCFIATVVVAAGDTARLDELRRFRDTRVRAVARGADYMDAFYSVYGEAGARIAAQIADDTVARKSLWLLLVAPVLSYLTVAVECPEEPLDLVGLPPSWAAFASELQEGLQCWGVSAMPPRVDAPSDDSHFVARYVLRSQAARQTFAESCSAGMEFPALRELIAGARERFAHTVAAFRSSEDMGDALPENCNPLVLVAADLLRGMAISELDGLCSAFDSAGHGAVFDTAFIGPLVHYLRLAALLPSGDLPDSLPSAWQDVIVKLRADIKSLSEAAMAEGVRLTSCSAQPPGTDAAHAVTQRTAAHVAGAFGNDVGSLADSIRWRYTVTLRNADTDNATYLNLRVYYLAQPGGPENMGLVTLPNLLPGEVAVFPLCECNRLMSYRIEGDLVLPNGTTGSFEFPDDDGMTAKRAGDPNPCEDSWAF